MTLTRINADQAGGILQTGRPSGFWYARTESGWLGMSADGERCGVCVGSFPEVLTWLFIKARTVTEDGRCPVRNASRDKEWRISRSTDPGIRIPGAEIKKWESLEPIFREGWGTNTIKPYRDEELTKKRRGGFGGAPAGPHVKTLERDEEIVVMKRKGYTNTEAAKELGVSPSTVRARVKRLRADGRLPAFDGPRPKAVNPEEEDDGRNRRRRWTEDDNDEMILMIREGCTNRDIARALGRTLKAVQWQSMKLLADGVITEADLGGFRLAARKARRKGGGPGAVQG